MLAVTVLQPHGAGALEGLRQPLLAAHTRVNVPASWPQVTENTSAEAQANWSALWAAIGRSDTALVFHMSDHYSLVHAARQYTLDLGMPILLFGLLSNQ